MTSMAFSPQDPDFDRWVRASFARQQVMATLGIGISRLSPGEVELTMPHAAAYTQQHGFIHAGIVATAWMWDRSRRMELAHCWSRPAWATRSNRSR